MTDPVYITASGLRAFHHADGALGIVADDGQGGSPAAIHLSAPQAEDLARFIGIVQKASEPPSILDEAREIIYGDREQTHGQPDHNLRAIAKIWSALLRGVLQDGHDVTPQLVCLMMAGLKLARAANRPSHREHALDAVGYMALMERCGFIDPK